MSYKLSCFGKRNNTHDRDLLRGFFRFDRRNDRDPTSVHRSGRAAPAPRIFM